MLGAERITGNSNFWLLEPIFPFKSGFVYYMFEQIIRYLLIQVRRNPQ